MICFLCNYFASKFTKDGTQRCICMLTVTSQTFSALRLLKRAYVAMGGKIRQKQSMKIICRLAGD